MIFPTWSKRQKAIFGQAPVQDGLLSVERAIAMLNDRDERRRIAAATALGQARDARAVRPLIAALADRPAIAVAAIDALGSIGGPEAVEPLVAALGSRSFAVREHAIAALGTTGDPRAIEPLIAKLQDRSDDFYIRKKAARTLYVIYKQGRLDREHRDRVLAHWHSWYLL